MKTITEYLEENLPSYSSDDRVLKLDLLYRYRDGETTEMSQADIEEIEGNCNKEFPSAEDIQDTVHIEILKIEHELLLECLNLTCD